VDLDQNLGRVKADFGQIEQVLFNLAINARDARMVYGIVRQSDGFISA
jgi:signal transduction histidine kinase